MIDSAGVRSVQRASKFAQLFDQVIRQHKTAVDLDRRVEPVEHPDDPGIHARVADVTVQKGQLPLHAVIRRDRHAERVSLCLDAKFQTVLETDLLELVLCRIVGIAFGVSHGFTSND